MSIDILQEKIRKTKNPTVLELSISTETLPPQFTADGAGFSQFCGALLEEMKGIIPAVRFSFGEFSLLGHDGLYHLSQTLIKARELGYYVLLDAPAIWSPAQAEQTAQMLFGERSLYPCDGLLIGGYLGSDVWKPFLPYCKKEKKDLFIITRTANKSAAELQDLLTGGRLVHAAAAEKISRIGQAYLGKRGYSNVAITTAASSSDSIRSLRAKHPNIFFLVDGYDYPNANAKNCSYGFDKFGHGAVVCSGTGITCAWKKAESDGEDYLLHAKAAAEKMKKNLSRYTTIL